VFPFWGWQRYDNLPKEKNSGHLYFGV
jgi:hypothetical protein